MMSHEKSPSNVCQRRSLVALARVKEESEGAIMGSGAHGRKRLGLWCCAWPTDANLIAGRAIHSDISECFKYEIAT
jgi:hypothetical protein